MNLESKLDMLATKNDLHKGLLFMTWKLFGFATALCTILVTATYWLSKYVH